MEAKDAVINIRKSVELPEDRSLLNMLDFADKAAELSFRAGEQESDKKWRQILKDSVALAKLAGRREVVEWIREHGYYSPWKFVAGEINLEWQTQLKEWGVD